MAKPKHYQQKGINDIFEVFKTSNRCFYQLSTGGGKTYLFSFLSKEFIGDSDKRVLILAHRKELIQQTVNTLYDIGVRSEAVIASKKYLNHSSQVYVCMVETIFNRLKKNPHFLPKIDLLVIDEAHIMTFIKVLDLLVKLFPEIKILGVSATPGTVIVEKTMREIGRGELMEYTQKFGLHKIYQNLVNGYDITDLINDGDLVPELLFNKKGIDREGLKFDEKTGDFKPENNHAEKFCVVTHYEKFSKDKKTIIFTASTKENLSLLSDFKEKGYENVRILDSVNLEESGDRQECLKWFKKTPDAILINTGILTTGFDEPTIESVILALSTASLMKLWQMIGRGGRSTKLIYKDKFILIDLGGNVDTFGKWSEPVNWSEHFYYTSKALPKKEALEKITFCGECDMIIPATAQECPFCGHEKKKPEKKLSESTVHVAELIYPSGEKIVRYCEMYSLDKSFAVNLMLEQCQDLFIFAEISLERFENTVKNGNFFKRMKRIIDIQMLFIENSDLKGAYKKHPITELITKLYKALK